MWLWLLWQALAAFVSTYMHSTQKGSWHGTGFIDGLLNSTQYQAAIVQEQTWQLGCDHQPVHLALCWP